MRRARTSGWLAILTLLAVTGCAVPVVLPGGGPAPPHAVPTGAADQPTPKADPVNPDFPNRSAAFAAHFTDPLYTDEGDEFAPFGSDEGSDTLYGWEDRRHELNRCSTVRWMVENDDQAGALDHPKRNGPDVDGFIIGAGFGLILLTGHIDAEGKQLVLDALQRTYSSYAKHKPREQPVMIRDLTSFPATDCPH